MSSKTYQCPHCCRNNFTSQRGLTQHLQRSSVCASKEMHDSYDLLGASTAEKSEGMKYTFVSNPIKKRRSTQEYFSTLDNNRCTRPKTLHASKTFGDNQKYFDCNAFVADQRNNGSYWSSFDKNIMPSDDK